MTSSSDSEIGDLIDRIARINASERWVNNLNPAQLAALSYLARANKYSRAPSQIAEYLCAMRGTVSATLKSLERKGLIQEQKSELDRRRTSYTLSADGLAALDFKTTTDAALTTMGDKEAAELANGLKRFVRSVLHAREDRSFGVCASCKYHVRNAGDAHCALLNVALSANEAAQVCFEHASAA